MYTFTPSLDKHEGTCRHTPAPTSDTSISFASSEAYKTAEGTQLKSNKAHGRKGSSGLGLRGKRIIKLPIKSVEAVIEEARALLAQKMLTRSARKERNVF